MLFLAVGGDEGVVEVTVEGVVDDAEVVEAVYLGGYAVAVEQAGGLEFLDAYIGARLTEATEDTGFWHEHGTGEEVAEAFLVGLFDCNIVWDGWEAGEITLVTSLIIRTQTKEEVAQLMQSSKTLTLGGSVCTRINYDNRCIAINPGGQAIDVTTVEVKFKNMYAISS